MSDAHTMLADATSQLLATMDRLGDSALARPSALPGWTRAHVLAHLALNGEALASALAGAAVGHDVPMYRSQAERDADIEVLAGHPAIEIRSRVRGGIRGFAGACSLQDPASWTSEIRRTPEDPRTFLASDAVGMRLRETEIHHCDLGTGRSRADWSEEFAVHLVDAFGDGSVRRANLLTGFSVRATDIGREWVFGTGPVVSGSVRDLGWWLTGRGGAGLVTDGGPLPEITSW